MQHTHAVTRDDEPEAGFTLIELMMVVLIIAILIAVLIPTFVGAKQRAQDRAVQSSVRNALTAAKVIYSDHGDYTEATAAGAQREPNPPSAFVDATTPPSGPNVVSVDPAEHDATSWRPGSRSRARASSCPTTRASAVPASGTPRRRPARAPRALRPRPASPELGVRLGRTTRDGRRERRGISAARARAPSRSRGCDAGLASPLVTAFVAVIAGVYGLVIGSFLNVVIWRVPRHESLVTAAFALPGVR